MASTRGHSIQRREHDIAFSLTLGCAIPLSYIALHYIVAYQNTVERWPKKKRRKLNVQKIKLNGMASAQGNCMQGTEHDVTFCLVLGCAIAIHCIALQCIILHCNCIACSQHGARPGTTCARNGA